MKLELIVKKWNGKKKKGVKKIKVCKYCKADFKIGTLGCMRCKHKRKKLKGFPKYQPFSKHKLIHKCGYCKSKFKCQIIGDWNPDVGPRCLKCLREGKGERVRHRQKKKRTIKFAMN